MALDNSIKQARRIINYGTRKYFRKLYRLTTENICGYIDKFDFEGKNLYTVGSSGDQAINANMYGCNDITIIDINPLAEHYIYLKIAAMKVYNYDDFLAFIHKNRDGILNKRMYLKIRDCLESIDFESRVFWDYIYTKFDINTVLKKLFNNFTWEQKYADKYNPYLLNEDNYNLAKSHLKNLKISFCNYNILKLNEIIDNMDNVDNIFLSNIYDYQTFKIKKFRKGVNNLANVLSDEGKMLISYLYNTSNDWTLLYFCSDDIIEDFIVNHFKGISGIYLNNNATDSAIIYDKKRLTKTR